jgi:L-fuconolactonase
VEIVDAQVHLNMMGIDAGVLAMDAVGVAALVVDEFEGFDAGGRALPGYPLPGGSFRHTCLAAEEAATRYPQRFGYVVRYQPDDPDLAACIGGLRSHPGRLALRLIPYQPSPPHAPDPAANRRAAAGHFQALEAGAYDRYLRLAERHGVPVFLQLAGIGVPGRPDLAGSLARRFPSLQLIVDHCGVELPSRSGARPVDADTLFAGVLALGQLPNVALKWSHAPRLSAERYPYADLMPTLHRVLEAFGPHRVMWASDWMASRVPYAWAETLYYLRDSGELSAAEKGWLLGRAARTVLRWPGGGGA